jgi:hypothetical protein
MSQLQYLTSDKSSYYGFQKTPSLQLNIMRYITAWVKKEKTPVPKKEIVAEMVTQGIKDYTTLNALNALAKKGFIRATSSFGYRGTRYIQLRSI